MKAHASIPRDRSKIVLDSENQVRLWTRHFGVTQQELARAIETVGNSAATVRKQLAARKTAVVWAETPTNPLLGIADIRALAEAAHEAGAPTLRGVCGALNICSYERRRCAMAWTTPTLVEICIGLEINGYLPAEF